MSTRAFQRRKFLALAGVAGAGAALAACAPQAPSVAPTAQPKAAAEPTKPASGAEATKPAGAAAPTQATAAPAAAKPTAAPAPASAAKPAGKTTVAESDAPAAPKTSMISNTMPAKFAESPMLTERVTAGKLPALDKRLPSEPLVIKPIEGTGQYGGTIRTGDTGTTMFGGDMYRVADGTQQFWLRIAPDLKSWEANIAKDMKVSDDKTTYTLTMRKGVKWSDGSPLTVKDFMFWFEDILQNKELQPSIPIYFRPGGKTMEMTAPDDYTIVIKFAVPQPFFPLSVLAHRQWYKNSTFHPAAYLKKFHSKYNTNATADAKAEKYDTWFAWFGDKANFDINKELPLLSPYVVTEVLPTVVRYERNPYFWQVDTDGNQLPYVDKCEMERVSNLELYNTKIVTGAYDVAAQQASILNYAAYEGGAAQGNYRIVLWNTGKGSECFYQVNMTIADPVLRKIHQDVRYRRALSLAINRDEINDLLYFGKSQPRQMTVLPECTWYKDSYAKSYAEYSPEKANALLDEMGLKWDAAKKVRQRPDGKALEINFDMVETETPKGPISELVVEYWRKIGVSVTFKSVTRQLLGPRVLANEEPMFLWHGDAVTDILLPTDRKWSTAKYGDDSGMAPLWAQWFETEGKQGEEPTLPEFKASLDAYVQFQKTGDAAAADKLLSLQAENLWSIGTIGISPHPVMVRKNLRNIVKGGAWTWDSLWTWPYHSATWYFKK